VLRQEFESKKAGEEAARAKKRAMAVEKKGKDLDKWQAAKVRIRPFIQPCLSSAVSDELLFKSVSH
jgi:hypothetical protein